MKTFINPTTGQKVITSDKAEIKMMKACCWKQVKAVKQVFAKGLVNGNSFSI